MILSCLIIGAKGPRDCKKVQSFSPASLSLAQCWADGVLMLMHLCCFCCPTECSVVMAVANPGTVNYLAINQGTNDAKEVNS